MPLPLIPIIAAGAALAGVGGASATSIGRNQNKHQNFGDSDKYDKNRFEYGGKPGAADAYAARYQASAGGWDNKANEYGAQQQGLFNQGQVGMQQQMAARAQQQQAADLMMRRANGEAPSIAQMQGDRAMGQAVAAQASQMASARGPAGLALAQQNAGNNMANAQGDIAGQSMVAAAQERLAAEQAAFGAYSGLRGTDLSSAQTAFGAGAQSGQLGLSAGTLAANYAGMENQVRQNQTQANIEQQRILSGSQQQGQQIESQQDQNNAARDMAMLKMALGAGADAGSAVGKIGAKAVGGPVRMGNPYLVGEQGPELIIPSQDGHVMTAPQTAGLLGLGGTANVPAGAAGMGPASAYQLAADGSQGLDVMGTMRANNAAALKYAHNPVGGPVARGLFG